MNKQDLYRTIATQLNKGETIFPTNVQLAMKLRKALEDPDCHVELAAKLISAEPVLAPRVVALANSVAYNPSGREITDVRTAISRIGFNPLRSMVMGLLTQQLAGSTSSATQAMSKQLWEHTAQVAALARALARHVTHVDPETALFAGIVREVGGFYLLACAERTPQLLEGGITEWTDAGEIEVSRAVLAKLAIPATVVDAIEGYWEGYLSMPPRTLSDTLLLADELASTPSPLRLPTTDDNRARLEIQIGEEQLSTILKESAEEISSLYDALHF